MNKKFNGFIFGVVISFLFMPKVNAAVNPYKKGTSWGEVNCTWYAWNMAYEYKKIVLPGWGNAKEWDEDAKKDGYEVGLEPKANSIIVWEDWTDYGHVGYVTSVDYDNDKLYVRASTECRTKPTKEMEDAYDKCYEEIYFSDPNSNQETDRYAHEQCVHLIKTELIPCEYQISEEKQQGVKFIYLDNIPKKNNNSNNSKPIEIKKSSNNNLSSLTISNIPLDFNKDVTTYNLEVENDIEVIEIAATLEDSKAKVVGTGIVPLVVGNNDFVIKVTAEDKSIKEYKISIIKKEKVVLVKPNEEKNKNNNEVIVNNNDEKIINKNNNNYILFIGIALIILTGFIITITLIKKSKNKKNDKNKKNGKRQSINR